MMWFALPSPSGQPDHQVGPRPSRMIYPPRIASGSVNSFRHQVQARGAVGTSRQPLDSDAAARSL